MNYNIITEYFNFSKSCVNNYLKKILGKFYDREAADKYLQVYMDTRYYGKYNNPSIPFFDNVQNNLNYIYKLNERLDRDKKMLRTIKAFNFIYYFDNVKECDSIKQIIDEIEEFRKVELGLNKNKKFNNDLFELVKEDLIKKKEYIDTVNSDKFYYDFSKTSKEGVFELIINQNLKFPIVYNSVIIDKVFNSADLSQRKATIEFSFGALSVLKDIIKGEFKFEYLVTYPSDISSKKTLFNKLMSIVDNEMLKERITIKITYTDFVKEKESIYDLIRQGFKFAVILANDFEETEENLAIMAVFKYIIINKRNDFRFVNNNRNIIYQGDR